MKTILIFGVRAKELDFFKSINKDFNYKLLFVEDFFITEKNLAKFKNEKIDMVMVRESINVGKKELKMIKDMGVDSLLTRTTGFNHIDMEEAKKLGFKTVQNVPAYSPNALGELSMSFAFYLSRRLGLVSDRTRNCKYSFIDAMLVKELRDMKVGVIGMGKIGYTTAKLYNAIGSEILAYDPYASDQLKKEFKFVDLKTLAKEADIITIHCPLVKATENLIDSKFLKDVKKDAIVINIARGPIVNHKDMLDWLVKNPQASFGSDVFEDEDKLFFIDHKKTPGILNKFEKLYPRVLITPHIGPSTTRALETTIRVSFENYQKLLDGKDLPNNLLK